MADELDLSADEKSIFNMAKERLGIRPTTLSYHPQAALMETVFVRDYPEEVLAVEYERLTNRIMAQVQDDPQNLAIESGELGNEKHDIRASIVQLIPLSAHQPEMGGGLLAQLSRAAHGGDPAPLPELRQLYAVLAQNSATKLPALNNWGVALADQAKLNKGMQV